jgi:thiol-disulfide isomerase/thioredoxin
MQGFQHRMISPAEYGGMCSNLITLYCRKLRKGLSASYMKLILSILFLFLYLPVKSQGINTIHLENISGEKDFLLKQVSSKLLVIVWLSPECPLCQNYTLTLNQLSEKYHDVITIVGVFPGASYTKEEYLAFQKKYSISFPLVTDKKRALADRIHATVTPEVFLYDDKRSLKYSGAIDNWVVSLGKSLKKATISYLDDAIVHTLDGKAASPVYMQPIGCFINDN